MTGGDMRLIVARILSPIHHRQKQRNKRVDGPPFVLPPLKSCVAAPLFLALHGSSNHNTRSSNRGSFLICHHNANGYSLPVLNLFMSSTYFQRHPMMGIDGGQNESRKMEAKTTVFYFPIGASFSHHLDSRSQG
jgi:hypothetical protein